MVDQRVKRSLLGLILFSLLFLVFVGGGTLLISGPPLTWGGDGAGPSSSRPISKILMILPFIIFFGGGIAASLSVNRELRIFIALAAHGFTLLLFLLGGRDNIPAFFLSSWIFFAVFAAPWWAVIRKAPHM